MSTIKLPFKIGQFGYFESSANLTEEVRQQIKVLISTEPGQRIMEVDYGAGLKRFLFEPNDDILLVRVRSYLTDKFTRYIPAIKVTAIDVSLDPERNAFFIAINFVFNRKGEVIKYKVNR